VQTWCLPGRSVGAAHCIGVGLEADRCVGVGRGRSPLPTQCIYAGRVPVSVTGHYRWAGAEALLDDLQAPGVRVCFFPVVDHRFKAVAGAWPQQVEVVKEPSSGEARAIASTREASASSSKPSAISHQPSANAPQLAQLEQSDGALAADRLYVLGTRGGALVPRRSDGVLKVR
jgi:hypothetical protein